MGVLLAVDKFKGSLTAAQAADALAAGIRTVRPDTAIRVAAVADGAGTVEAAVAAGFERVDVEVSGPTGAAVRTSYARRCDTVVIELANVCGLQQLPGSRLEPWTSSTYGLGEVIGHAIGAGARNVVIGVGGSASTDGGAGLLQALDAVLRDSSGADAPRSAVGLRVVHTVDLTAVRARSPASISSSRATSTIHCSARAARPRSTGRRRVRRTPTWPRWSSD